MPEFHIIWSDEIEEHLAEHGVTRAEFAEVVLLATEVETSRSTGNPIVFGWTSTGKHIACVYEDIDGYSIVPVTAYEVEP